DEAEKVFYEALRVDPGLAPSKLGLGAPAGTKKGPSDIILRGALRLYSIPYRIILAPACAVMAIEIPWLILTLGGSWLVKGVSLTLATWGWCYILSLVYVRVIGQRRGIQLVSDPRCAEEPCRKNADFKSSPHLKRSGNLQWV